MRKKLYTILGTFALITAFTIVFVPKEVVNVYADDQSANVAANIQVGDLNGDNIIDSSDAVLIKKYLSGSTIEGFTEKNADLNGDGEVTSVDSVLLMKYLAGYDVKIQPQPDSEIAKTVKYTNNDYVYHPSMEEIKYDSDENVIYFNNLLTVYTFTDLNEIEMKELTDAVDGTVVGDISGCVNVLQIEVKDCSFNELNEKANTLMENENVLYAGYDYPMQMSDDSVSSDPWNSNPNKPESDLGNEDAHNGNDWWAEAIGAYTAWDNVHDDISKIKVGIIDSGFETDHEDLNGKITLLDNYPMNSKSNHGTHVAGVIGAISDNNIGIRGIVDNVEMVCIDWNPVTNDSNDKDNYISYLTTEEYTEMIKHPIENGVKVINNSYGRCLDRKMYYNIFDKSGNNDVDYEEYKENQTKAAKQYGLACTSIVIQLLMNDEKDFLIIQSAGNGYNNGDGIQEGIDAKNAGYFCAITRDVYNELFSTYDEESRIDVASHGVTYNAVKEHILIVGSVKNEKVNNNYKMAESSNFGDRVDICAPGEKIFSTVVNSTFLNHKYDYMSGTSMAAPIVTGSAALVWANDPSLTAAEVKKLLIDSSTSKAICQWNGEEYPMLNLGNAILMQSPEYLFRKYVSENLKTIKTSKTLPLETGTFSVSIDDFDKNGSKEMVTFSFLKNSESAAQIVLDLYVIEDGEVVKKNSSKVIYASFAGTGEASVCAMIENGQIKLSRDSISYGGNIISSEYLCYNASNLTLLKDYSLWEYGARDDLEYEEKVSGTKYSNSTEMYTAMNSNGFNSYIHKPDEIRSIVNDNSEDIGNHIFVLLKGDCFSKSGFYRYLIDTSRLKDPDFLIKK